MLDHDWTWSADRHSTEEAIVVQFTNNSAEATPGSVAVSTTPPGATWEFGPVEAGASVTTELADPGREINFVNVSLHSDAGDLLHNEVKAIAAPAPE